MLDFRVELEPLSNPSVMMGLAEVHHHMKLLPQSLFQY